MWYFSKFPNELAGTEPEKEFQMCQNNDMTFLWEDLLIPFNHAPVSVQLPIQHTSSFKYFEGCAKLGVNTRVFVQTGNANLHDWAIPNFKALFPKICPVSRITLLASLSKGKSDLKQKCTQLFTLISWHSFSSSLTGYGSFGQF